MGKVAVNSKTVGNRQVMHLLNFTDVNSLDWRDTHATQPKPALIENATLDFTATGTVKKMWVASPDFNNGVATPLLFTQTGNKVSFTLPSLQYWDMLVAEY